ncbi:MAG: hypothetical protein ABSE51_09190 [Terracidiphilus sp.]|jgi:uncharacterized Zn finger protein
MGWGYYPPYVSVEQRRAKALREVHKLSQKGGRTSPVHLGGRVIATTFWGRAWCENLESYSDFENRLPRGRTYVRNGSVVDLQVETGKVTSLVSGSSLYRIRIDVRPLTVAHWKKIKGQCGGQIGSLVELLQGRLSSGVMKIVTGREFGLFPAPGEIEMSCSCPDWAEMCKHVAATLYGVGCRLDSAPELFFKLRGVDHLELIAQAGRPMVKAKGAEKRKTIAMDRLADVFGIELETSSGLPVPSSPAKLPDRGKRGRSREKQVKQSSEQEPKQEKPRDSSSAAKSKSRTLSTPARKRIAQAIKDRREAQRKAGLSSNGAATAAASEAVKRSAKSKAAQPAKGGPRDHVSSVRRSVGL